MSDISPAQEQSSSGRKSLRGLAAAAVGNLIEFYDFSVYGLLAIPLALHFFPTADPAAGLLATLLLFAAAFVIRPLGGLFFGHLGDRKGRKTALSVTVLLMAAATVLMGLLPSYATIGIAATILLVLTRLVQGFAAGGELGGALTYVAETVERRRRGRSTASVQAGGFLGIALASMVVALISYWVGQENFVAWGWRITLLLALPMAAIGFYIRLKLDETPALKELKAKSLIPERAPLRVVFRDAGGVLFKIWGLSMLQALTAYFCVTFLFIYASRYLGMSSTAAAWANAGMIVVGAACTPFFGSLSDRFGRKPIMIVGAAAWLVLTYPILLMMGTKNAGLIFLGMCVLFLLYTFYASAWAAMTVEILPARVRYTGTALGTTIPLMLFGGTAPYLSALVIDLTGNNLAPALLIVPSAIVALILVAFIPETKDRELRPQLDQVADESSTALG